MRSMRNPQLVRQLQRSLYGSTAAPDRRIAAVMEDSEYFQRVGSAPIEDAVREPGNHSPANAGHHLWKCVRVRGNPIQRVRHNLAKFVPKPNALRIVPVASFSELLDHCRPKEKNAASSAALEQLGSNRLPRDTVFGMRLGVGDSSIQLSALRAGQWE